MIAYDPTKRPTIDEILKHPWVGLNVPESENISAELNKSESEIEENE